MEDLLRRWNLFAVIATSICTCISGFLILPPVAQAKSSLSHFGIFLVTLLVALWSIPVSVWGLRREMKIWLTLSLLLIISSIAGYFFYQQRMTAWTFTYPPGRENAEQEISGVTLSEKAKKIELDLIAAGRSHGAADLVWQMGGSFVEVWPNTEEREVRLETLLAIYLGLLLVCASTVVCTVQATFCLSHSLPTTSPEDTT